ncbi:circadian locomoter output cycles protein kaput isoform X2 [Venturia canescens]|uniref:circadian locomoter output cycles protein kaput isoform X2 n=1 Tax=Venturia canescens TaxID=32260 RepID=UPI001C9BC932|nr:circadian locomoter output cycles protein kaput-like isoform X2 [Venturia canescens]XP_043281621.1 circadian locomoter output cycles protein kaput-like isoform X2 [Venturia canescens]XP_043281623.1 circadian locomoter output cycles protein kaput-like isoform X2 [Venturia canescens]
MEKGISTIGSCSVANQCQFASRTRARISQTFLKPPQKDGVTKSNPSKRHRERLNAELDTLASLLPFEQNILSKLDRLSILRLSVSYLRTKSYFQVVMHKDKEDNSHHDSHYRARELAALAAYDHHHLDGEMFLQALNGFLLILTCDGEVFFATHSIESYLGFHQSDIVHQSVYELVHSEDREELQRQLMWNSFLPAESANLPLHDALTVQHGHLLERSFTVRFRCLLDNTSGFLRLDIRGRVKVLHGQNRKTEDPPLALFALCTPFGPPSLLEVPQKEVMFKSKHKLDLALVSMDQRGKMLLGYADAELANLGGYDLVHYDDLAYVASAHQELLKTGASGMIAYRYQMKDGGWQWLQTSSRLVYKNSKPDFVISTHRPLMEEEGRDLLGKRTMDFKVSYLDAGLTNSYFSDNESLTGSSITPTLPAQPAPQRVNRRYKTQLRDFLSTCRSKRTKMSTQSPASPPAAPTVASVDYLTAADSSAAAAVAAAYSNLNTMYPTPYAPAAVAATTDPSLTTYIGHTGNYHQTLYPGTALDNRYLTATENLFQYRPLGSYYPEYHTTTAYNGFIDVSLPTYDTHQLASKTEERLYCQQLAESPKYSYVDTRHPNSVSGSPYASSPVTGSVPLHPTGGDINVVRTGSRHSLEGASSSNSAGSSPVTTANGIRTPKMEDVKPEVYGSEVPRQTVLMWGPPPSRTPPRNNGSYSPPTPHATHPGNPGTTSNVSNDPLKSLADMGSINGDCNKWKQTSPTGQSNAPSPSKNKNQQQQHQHQQHQQQQQYPVTSSHYGTVPTTGYSQSHHTHPGHGDSVGSEVWQGVQHHHHYQYYPYHHHHPAPPRHTPHTSPSPGGTETGSGIVMGMNMGMGMDSSHNNNNNNNNTSTNNNNNNNNSSSSSSNNSTSSSNSNNNNNNNDSTTTNNNHSNNNNNNNNSSSSSNTNTTTSGLYHPAHHHHHHHHLHHGTVGSSGVAVMSSAPQITNRTPGVLCCPSLR